MRTRVAVVASMLLAAVSSSGCAAVGLTLFSIGAGVGTGTGVSYTLDSLAFRRGGPAYDALSGTGAPR